MFKSPLFRRVGIYLVLSTAAVAVVNQSQLEQQNAYQIYIPMFIGIYVLSRWIDSRFNETPTQKQTDAGQTQTSTSESTTERGFGS